MIVPQSLSCPHVIGTDEKLKKCLELGADVGINYKKEDFVERVRAETGGKGRLPSRIHFSAEIKLIATEKELNHRKTATEYDWMQVWM